MRRLMPSLLILLTCAAAGRAADERPNFLIFIADDVGWNDIGPYGNSQVGTPNLDRLAKEGLRFDRAFLTCSSCSPSRASIMTGRYPHSTGAAELHQPLPADQVVFAGLLKEAGYYTASAGKWHLGPHAKKNFDRIEGGGASGCEKWVPVLKERPKDRPFFFWFASFDAHRGYGRNAIDKPHSPEDAVVPPYLPDVPATRRDLALYYDEITRLDSYIGQVLDELEKQGELDNTLVLFLSDNGRPFPRAKTTVYDSGVKTPLLVRWPERVKAGGACGELVSSVDIAPTLVELAGLEPSPTFQGESFVSLLDKPNEPIRKAVFAEHNWHDYKAHQRAARTKRFLYIHNALPQLPQTPPADAVRSPTFQAMRELHAAGKLPPEQRDCFIAPRPTEELYDVAADPYSLRNLADAPGYRDELRQMRAALAQWRERTQDAVPESLTPDKFDRETGRPLKK